MTAQYASALAAFLIVLGCVFLHGQADEPIDDHLPMRVICTALVTAAITYASYLRLPCWPLSLVVATSTACAFCWGPEIGWNAAVRRTQAYKGLWLALGVFPFGVAYGALRPLAYWIGYTKFTPSTISDEVARGLSGLFLGALVFVTIAA